MDAMQFLPTPGYILVQPDPKQTKSDGGILLPEDRKDSPMIGTVLMASKSAYDHGIEIPCPCKAGDRVIFRNWGGNKYFLDHTEYHFLKYEDILCTISSS